MRYPITLAYKVNICQNKVVLVSYNYYHTHLLLPTTKPVILLVVTVQITSRINMTQSYLLISLPYLVLSLNF